MRMPLSTIDLVTSRALIRRSVIRPMRSNESRSAFTSSGGTRKVNVATPAAVGSSFDDATDKLTIGPITDNWQDGKKARVHFHFLLDGKWQDKRIEMDWNDPQGLSTPAICASIIAAIIKRAYGPDGTGIIDDAVSDGASICITKAGASDGFGSASPLLPD